MQKIFLVFVLVFLITFGYSQTKVACIGNSITYGYGLSSPSTQSYPSKLQTLLGSNYKVSNFGVSARTLLKNGDRPYWNEAQYNQSLALNPDIVIIMLGTNDAKLNTNWLPHKNEFIGDYKALIKSYENLSSNPQIWICKLVPAYQTIWDISNTTINNEVNPKIQQVAVDEGLSLIDMYAEMSNKATLFQSDGIHPNANGAQAMANYIYEVINGDTLTITEQNDSLKAPLGTSYQWYFNDIILADSLGGNKQMIKPVKTGNYKVGVTLSESSSTTVFTSTLSYTVVPESTKGLNKANSLIVGPNPCSSMLTLGKLERELTEFRLFSLNGTLIFSKLFLPSSNEYRMNLTLLADGNYIYTISIKEEVVKNGKIVIDHSLN